MASLKSFRELLVWQKSMVLSERCYRSPRRFKRDDQDLAVQLRKRRLGLVTDDEARAYIADAEEIGRMLTGLIRSLEGSPRT